MLGAFYVYNEEHGTVSCQTIPYLYQIKSVLKKKAPAAAPSSVAVPSVEPSQPLYPSSPLPSRKGKERAHSPIQQSAFSTFTESYHYPTNGEGSSTDFVEIPLDVIIS